MPSYSINYSFYLSSVLIWVILQAFLVSKCELPKSPTQLPEEQLSPLSRNFSSPIENVGISLVIENGSSARSNHRVQRNIFVENLFVLDRRKKIISPINEFSDYSFTSHGNIGDISIETEANEDNVISSLGDYSSISESDFLHYAHVGPQQHKSPLDLDRKSLESRMYQHQRMSKLSHIISAPYLRSSPISFPPPNFGSNLTSYVVNGTPAIRNADTNKSNASITHANTSPLNDPNVQDSSLMSSEKSDGGQKSTHKKFQYPLFGNLNLSVRSLSRAQLETSFASSTDVPNNANSTGDEPVVYLHCQKPQYVVYTWVLCMMILGGFLKLKYLAKTAIVFAMMTVHIILLYTLPGIEDFMT